MQAAGELITETLEYDGGRDVTVHVPVDPPEAIVFAGDGQLIAPWGRLLEATDAPSTMVVGAHRVDDETLRLHEYSPVFDGAFWQREFPLMVAWAFGRSVTPESG